AHCSTSSTSEGPPSNQMLHAPSEGLPSCLPTQNTVCVSTQIQVSVSAASLAPIQVSSTKRELSHSCSASFWIDTRSQRSPRSTHRSRAPSQLSSSVEMK